MWHICPNPIANYLASYSKPYNICFITEWWHPTINLVLSKFIITTNDINSINTFADLNNNAKKVDADKFIIPNDIKMNMNL